VWATYCDQLQRRWLQVAASMLVCALLGSALWGLARPNSITGVWTWSLLGAGCALAVGLTWPIRPALRQRRRAGGVPVEMTQASALAEIARRRRWSSRARGFALGAAAAAVVCLVAFGAFRLATAGSGNAAEPATPQASAVVPQPDAPPAPEPVISIGTHILVVEPDEPGLRR